MARNIEYAVTSYSVTMYNCSGFGWIQLRNGDRDVGYIYLLAEPYEFGAFSSGEDPYIISSQPISHWHVLIDLLRNESPLYIRGYQADEGAPVHTFFGTTSQESAGEGEHLSLLKRANGKSESPRSLAADRRRARTPSVGKHFYIYNECDEPIDASVEFVPIGGLAAETYSTVVQPGNQRMMCFTEANSVVSWGRSGSSAKEWSRERHALTDREYTHVLACNCVGEDCPLRFPNPDSRQNPS